MLGNASTMGFVEAEVGLRETASRAAMEATLAALRADAAAAQRLLRRPRRRLHPRPRDIPRLWDARPIDPRPDDCWRCDAASSADELGLCPACLQALAR